MASGHDGGPPAGDVPTWAATGGLASVATPPGGDVATVGVGGPGYGGLTPGAMVGEHLRIEGAIGAGGMGVVYLARHLKLERPVAVKLHRAAPGTDTVARLEREAKAMARLSHPNVLGVYDVGALADGLYIAMEYVDGSNARQWLMQPKPWRKKLDLFVQAGEGLAAAHATGLVHRDFKPENVLVGKDGRVRVADFGLARTYGGGGGSIITHIDGGAGASPMATAGLGHGSSNEVTLGGSGSGGSTSLTATGGVVGTPAYMAPEQFSPEPVDARADQFAFCVALFEALNGYRPYGGNSPVEIYSSITTGRIHPPPSGSEVPAAIQRALVRGLRPDPAQRYPTMNELLADIRPAPTKPVGLLVGVGVAGVVIGGGVLGLVVWNLRSEPEPEPAEVVLAVAEPTQETPNVVLEAAETAAEVEEPAPKADVAAKAPEEPKMSSSEAMAEMMRLDPGDPGYQKRIEELSLIIAEDDDFDGTDALWGIGKGLATKPELKLRKPVWDGRSTLSCGMNEALEVVGKTIVVKKGPAFKIDVSCTLVVRDCTIEAPVVIDAKDGAGAELLLENVKVKTGMVAETKMNNLEVKGLEMLKPAKVAFKLGFATELALTDSEVRGDVAIWATSGAKVRSEGGSITGKTAGIRAEGLAVVRLSGTEFSGPVEKASSARVIEE